MIFKSYNSALGGVKSEHIPCIFLLIFFPVEEKKYMENVLQFRLLGAYVGILGILSTFGEKFLFLQFINVIL